MATMCNAIGHIYAKYGRLVRSMKWQPRTNMVGWLRVVQKKENISDNMKKVTALYSTAENIY